MALGKGKVSKTFIWILMGLLMIGLAGFGATSLTGTARSVATVGDKDVTVDAYLRGLRNELNALSAQAGRTVTMAEAQEIGLDRQVLSQLVTARALDNEADRIGLSVGDAQVAEQLRAVPAFRGADGEFDREAYRFALRNNGLTEAEFETQLREETARTLLQSAIVAGNALPETYTDTLLAYSGETRDFTWATLTAADLQTGLPVPDEDRLRAYYEENIDAYTLPERRDITYLWLTPEMIVDTVEVDEDALRAAYEEREEEFNLPERRLVERLVFADEASAEAAMARLDEGTDFETLVEERGLALADIDLGDVTREDLGAAAEPVFAAEPGAVVGPAPSDLGPALFRINGVLEAQTTTFEQARPDLRDALALDRARRVIEGLAQSLDDELAAGATLEELAADTEARLGQITWHSGMGDGIAGYDAFRELAASLEEGDFPEMRQLGDGGIFALRLNEIVPPSPEPFETVRDRVQAGWDRRETTRLLEAQAETLAEQIGAGSGFEEAGIAARQETGLGRNARLADMPPAILSAVFDMAPGDLRVVPGAGEVHLVRLDAINPVDEDDADMQALARALRDQAASDIAQDLYRAYAAALQSSAGITLNQSAINAVHANIQ